MLRMKDQQAIRLPILQPKKYGGNRGWRIVISFLFIMVFVSSSWCVEAMDLHVKKAPLRALVLGIAKSASLNVLGSEYLEGTVDLSVEGMEPRDILQRIGEVKGIPILWEQGTITILSPKMGGIEAPLILEARHIRLDVLAEFLSGTIDRNHIRMLPNTNQIVVTGSLKEREAAKEIVAAVDVAPKQVRLEAKVVALRTGYLREQGWQWDWKSLTSAKTEAHEGYGSISYGKSTHGDAYAFFFKPELSLLEEEGNGKIVAEPHVMTMNGERADILIGDKVPVQVETKDNGERRTAIRYEEAGIKLQYTPYVLQDGYIDATILAEVSTPELVKEIKAYRITTRQASTRVRLKAGDILVIGGLMDTREEKSLKKIPFLGDIPILGKLFQYMRNSEDKVELVIAIRATIYGE